MKKVKGFAIIVSDGQLRYDGYTYFTTSTDTAENKLDEVRDEFPDLRVVPAIIQYDPLPNAKDHRPDMARTGDNDEIRD